MEPTAATDTNAIPPENLLPTANIVPELTLRALLAGVILGVLIMAQNVYMGLKTGITEAGSILAAILCFASFRSFRRKLSILENNTAQTLSSAAGSIGIIVSVVPALQLLGYQLSGVQIFVWVVLIGFLGLLFAIPLRKQMLTVENLTFPTGTACAETIRAMHAHGDDATAKAKALGVTSIVSAVVTWFRDAVPIVIPTTTWFPGRIGAYGFDQLSLGIYWSPMIMSVGLLIGIRVGLSLFIGAIVSWGILGPLLADAHIIEKVSHTNITHWTMWPAIALMVASGFTSLATKGGMIARSFRSVRDASYERDDFPYSLWLGGTVVAALGVLIALAALFGIPVWIGIIAILLSFVLATVAMRAYGETDINPVGTMGHANQIAAGILAPGSATTNLAAGGVTAGCSDVSADLMQVLKTGTMLGATPRRQVYTQFIGVTVGAIVAVLIYSAVTQSYGIGTEAMPAPGAIPWVGMSKLLSQGTAALPSYGLTAILVGAVLGIVLTLLSKIRGLKYLPSPYAIGIGMVVPGFISFSIFLGALVGMIIERKAPKWAEQYLTPVASGGIAGEAILGVLISILAVFGILAG